MGLYHHIVKENNDDDDCRDEVRSALKDLIREDLDAWKTIYMDLSATWWGTQHPLWRDAVRKELGINDGQSIKRWIRDGMSLCP